MEYTKARYREFYDIDETLVMNSLTIPSYKSAVAIESSIGVGYKYSKRTKTHLDTTQKLSLLVPAFQDALFFDYLDNLFIGLKNTIPRVAVQTGSGKVYRNTLGVTLQSERFNGALAVIIGHNKFAIVQLGEFFEKQWMNYSQTNNDMRLIDKTKVYSHCRKIDNVICYNLYSELDERRKRFFEDFANTSSIKGKLLARDNLIADALPHEILSLTSNLYTFDNYLYINLHMAKDRYELSYMIELLSSLNKILTFNSDSEFSFQSNLASPGDITLFCSNAAEFIQANWYILVLLAVTLFGGEINTPTVKIQSPSVVNFIKWIAAYKARKETEVLELEIKKEDLRCKRLDNDFKEEQLNKRQSENELFEQAGEKEFIDAVAKLMEISTAMNLVSAPDYTLNKEALLESLSVPIAEE